MTIIHNQKWPEDWLTDLAGEDLTGAELRAALQARLQSEEEVAQAALEVETARRVHLLMARLQEAEIEVPEGFEARLMARVHNDRTLLELLELYLAGFGLALVELINALLSLIGTTEEPRAAAL